MMTKFCALFAALLLTCLTSAAQDNSEWQLYGGYQYTQIDTHAVQDIFNLLHVLEPTVPLVNYGAHQNMKGWDFGLQQNTNSWFGGVLDVSGSYDTNNLRVLSTGGVTVALQTTLRAYTLMAGPQFTSRRSSNFQPFARALFGGAFYKESLNVVANNVPLLSPIKQSDQSIALGGGGGVDLIFSRRVGLRLTGDYIRSYVFGESQNNYRATAGFVFNLAR
jgi:opacity protein-like surface antigen